MSTIKLHKDYLLEELNLPYSAIKDTITSTSRWSENHEIIFANDGKFYKTSARKPMVFRPWDEWRHELSAYFTINIEFQ